MIHLRMGRPGEGMSSMTADQLDDYISMLFRRHDEFGAEYVRRQVEWAEAELQTLLAVKQEGAERTAPPQRERGGQGRAALPPSTNRGGKSPARTKRVDA